jgi:hypothetical protein
MQKLDASLSRARLLLFRCGVLVGILCSATVVCSWFHPFPLLPDGQGGYSDKRNFMLSTVALFTAPLPMLLAIFGRGAARLLLTGSGILLVVLAYRALLSNGH